MKKNKFSIIVPVYNVEEYLEECFDSVLNQNYSDYEVIIVCDKSDDNSEDIVDKYVENYTNFKKIYREGTGLAIAKNEGLKNITGDYILFLDSDDFFEPNLLNVLSKELLEQPDILRFQVQDFKNGSTIKRNEKPFEVTNGTDAFEFILKYHYIENSWCYVYKATYWNSNNFNFFPNCIAEDFGLTPLVIANAKSVKSISFIGYNYRYRENSLMNNVDYSKHLKKMEDMIIQARFLKKELLNIKNSDKVIMFINNSLLYYSTTLEKKDYKKYLKILKNENIFDFLPVNGFKNKIKKIIIKSSPWFFYNYIAR